MTQHYSNYFWNDGAPVGTGKKEFPQGKTYKMPSDPYHKWISIEEYADGNFIRVLYDSKLFDFRTLKPEKQLAWHKEPGIEGACSYIRDQNDRLILIEHYLFEKEYCRECRTLSPHGIPVSTQKMFYTVLGDAWDGVELYDANAFPVMKKVYSAEENTGLFLELLKQEWNMQNIRNC